MDELSVIDLKTSRGINEAQNWLLENRNLGMDRACPQLENTSEWIILGKPRDSSNSSL